MRTTRPPSVHLGDSVDPVDPTPPPEHPPGLGEDSGPNPLVRAVAGLFVGFVAGAVAASLIPRPDGARPDRARRGRPSRGPASPSAQVRS